MQIGVLEDRKTVVELGHRRRRPDAAFDDDGIDAGHRGDDAVEVVVDIQAVGPGDLPPERVDQTPADPIAVVRTQGARIKIQAVTGGRFEAVKFGFVRTIEAAADRRADCKRRCIRQVEEAERKRTHLVADGVDVDRVRTRGEVEHRARAAELKGLGVVELAAVDDGAVRADQGPAQVGHIVVRRQAVEDKFARGVEREGVAGALASMFDRRAGGFADGQRAGDIGHLLDIEGVVEARHRLRRPDAAFDEQRVVAGQRQRGDIDIVIEMEAGSAKDAAAEWVVQAPACPVAVVRAEGPHIEEKSFASGCAEAIDIGFVGRIQRADLRRAGCKRGRRGEVEDTETVVAGGRAVGKDAHLVGAGQRQRDHRVATKLEALGVVHHARRNFFATRADQAPAETAVVVGRKTVENDALAGRAGKGVEVGLGSGADRAVDTHAKIDRRALERGNRRIAVELDAEGEADFGGVESTAFDEQGVGARQAQAVRPAVDVHVVRAKNEPAGRIDQAPVPVATAHRRPVEEHLVTGRRVDAPGFGEAARVQRAADVSVVGQHFGVRQVEQAESKAGRLVAGGIDAQRVAAGAQAQRGAAAEIARVGVGKRALRDQRAS